MNKFLFIAIAIVLMVCVACGKHISDPTDNPVCGGYSAFRDLTTEDLALFDSVYTQQPPLTPYAVATQVVAGLNYRFLCLDAAQTKYQVNIFVPLAGDSEDDRPVLTGVFIVEE